jgi:hypothetical protein
MEFWSDEKEYLFIKSSPDITPLLQYSIDPWNNYAINNRQSTINNLVPAWPGWEQPT